MSYSIIQPPFTLKFRTMSKRELADYFSWFMTVMPERIGILEEIVRTTSGYEAWRADYMPGSLDDLGLWYADQVSTRDRTPQEVAEIREVHSLSQPISTSELTNRTYSLAMDIGMYLGEAVRRTHSDRLRWGQLLKNKRDADFGQVSIMGSCPMVMNPVGLVVSLAWGILTKKRDGAWLREIYNAAVSPDSPLLASGE